MTFRIGQQVVAVRDHRQGCFKKGDVFTVLDVKKHCCKEGVLIQIKCKTPARWDGESECNCCGYINTGIWFCQYYFKPLLATFKTMTFKQVINQVVTSDN